MSEATTPAIDEAAGAAPAPSSSDMGAPQPERRWGHLSWPVVRLALALAATAGLSLAAHQRHAQRHVPAVVALAPFPESSHAGDEPVPVPDQIAAGTAHRVLPEIRLDPRIDPFLADARAPRPRTVIPPEQRWRIEFPAGLTAVPYADQLDAIGMELAVIYPDGKITYVTGLSGETPQKRHGDIRGESRIYFTWTRGDLEELDRLLLSNVDVDIGDGVVVHFLSEELEKTMRRAEQTFKKQPVERILETVFKVRKTFRGYELYVVRQETREAAR